MLGRDGEVTVKRELTIIEIALPDKELAILRQIDRPILVSA